VYTISDSQGTGNLPTVRSTVAGETFIAYARVSAASASAAGKPGRIILRERVGATGSILKETAVSFTLPPVGQWAFPSCVGHGDDLGRDHGTTDRAVRGGRG
jgi:hypothetical protein